MGLPKLKDLLRLFIRPRYYARRQQRALEQQESAVREAAAARRPMMPSSHERVQLSTSQVIQRKMALFRTLMSAAPPQDAYQTTEMLDIACREHEIRLQAVVSSMPPMVYNRQTGSYDIAAPWNIPRTRVMFKLSVDFQPDGPDIGSRAPREARKAEF